MIKVNLLSQLRGKKVRKKMEVQSQLWLFCGLLVVLILVLGYFWFYLNDRIDSLQRERMTMTQNLGAMKEKVREVESFEKDKKSFGEKIKIIQQLKLNQSGPVLLLDQVSRSLPARVWLIGLTQEGKTVTITGKAITNSELVDFIDNMKRSKFFSDIELLESRQGIEGNIPIYNFKLNCTMTL